MLTWMFSVVPVWCCAHSAQRCHLFLLTSINVKKPPRLVFATRHPKRKQRSLPQHGGLSRSSPRRRRPEFGRARAAARPSTAAAQEEAGGLQVWQDTGRGLLLNGTAPEFLSPSLNCAAVDVATRWHSFDWMSHPWFIWGEFRNGCWSSPHRG